MCLHTRDYASAAGKKMKTAEMLEAINSHDSDDSDDVNFSDIFNDLEDDDEGEEEEDDDEDEDDNAIEEEDNSDIVSVIYKIYNIWINISSFMLALVRIVGRIKKIISLYSRAFKLFNFNFN